MWLETLQPCSLLPIAAIFSSVPNSREKISDGTSGAHTSLPNAFLLLMGTASGQKLVDGRHGWPVWCFFGVRKVPSQCRLMDGATFSSTTMFQFGWTIPRPARKSNTHKFNSLSLSCSFYNVPRPTSGFFKVLDRGLHVFLFCLVSLEMRSSVKGQTFDIDNPGIRRTHTLSTFLVNQRLCKRRPGPTSFPLKWNKGESFQLLCATSVCVSTDFEEWRYPELPMESDNSIASKNALSHGSTVHFESKRSAPFAIEMKAWIDKQRTIVWVPQIHGLWFWLQVSLLEHLCPLQYKTCRLDLTPATSSDGREPFLPML